MPALRQYKLPSRLPDPALDAVMEFFNNKADTVVMVGSSEKNGQTWYHYEALFIQPNDVPENDQGKPDINTHKADPSDTIPHHYLGFETLEEFEIRKGLRPDPNI